LSGSLSAKWKNAVEDMCISGTSQDIADVEKLPLVEVRARAVRGFTSKELTKVASERSEASSIEWAVAVGDAQRNSGPSTRRSRNVCRPL
jgi:hypothetical protein